MDHFKLPHWLAKIVAVMGGGGLFLVAFFDSSVLSFPFIPDALVISLSAQKPARMPYYAAMAAIGSLAGCIWLYLLAKKGGEAYFHRHGGKAALKAKQWVDSNAFLSVFIPGILPPPFPFKVFVLAAGVFQVPLRTFILALLLARGLHYAIEGILAVRYGNAVLFFLTAHKAAFILVGSRHPRASLWHYPLALPWRLASALLILARFRSAGVSPALPGRAISRAIAGRRPALQKTRNCVVFCHYVSCAASGTVPIVWRHPFAARDEETKNSLSFLSALRPILAPSSSAA